MRGAAEVYQQAGVGDWLLVAQSRITEMEAELVALQPPRAISAPRNWIMRRTMGPDLSYLDVISRVGGGNMRN